MLLVFLSVTVRIDKNVLNKVPVESSILADFANYHLKSFNGKFNGSRKNNIHGSIWTQNGKSGRQVRSLSGISEGK